MDSSEKQQATIALNEITLMGNESLGRGKFGFRERFSIGLNIAIVLKLYRRGKSFMESRTSDDRL